MGKSGPSLTTAPRPHPSHLPPDPRSSWQRSPAGPSSLRGEGRGRWDSRRKATQDIPFPGGLQPWGRGRWANDQLGTLGEMGQSFLDKRGFYQPIKIPLSLICWLLLQAPGNRWKGGQKKGPEDEGGMAGGGGHVGQGGREEAVQASRLREPKICCRVWFPAHVPPSRLLSLFYARRGVSPTILRTSLVPCRCFVCVSRSLAPSPSVNNTFIYFIPQILI